MYNYQVTAHRATAVTHALVGHFTSPTELSLVLSKGSRIEVHEVTSEGLVPILDVPIYGRIAAIEKFRPKTESLDLLFISTERFKFCVLAIDPVRKVFITKSHGDLSDKIGVLADFGQLLFIDPESRVIGLHLYRGVLKIIPINVRNGNLMDAINIHIEEQHVVDIKFLSTANPTIAVLYQDQREMRHVKTYELSLKDKELMEGQLNAPNVEVSASLLVPLQEPLGGVLLLGERSITYINGENKSKSLAIKPSIISCYAQLDASRVLLADHVGRLWLLVLQLTPDGRTLNDFTLELLGETSTASCLAYLDNKVLFVGSTLGDSQLIRLTPERDDVSGDFLQLLESYTNIGPIVDMTTVEMDRLLANAPGQSATLSNASTVASASASQTQIVSCSGAYKDGSLRVIRNGIGISEHAQLDLEGILRVFSLQLSSAASSSSMDVDNSLSELPVEKLLFVSYVSETRLLKISGEELEEIRLAGVATTEPTLLATNLQGAPHLVIQVTPKAVYVIDITKPALVDTWKLQDQNINVTAVFQSLVAVGLGSTLQLLSVGDNGKIVESSKKTLAHELACVALTGESGEVFCAVGQWHENSVHILHVLSSGKGQAREVHKETLGGEILPRSLVFANFDERASNQLLVGMGDGHVYSFAFDPASALHTSHTAGGDVTSSNSSSTILTHKKKMILGRQPVNLVPFSNKGKNNVLACGDRPTVVYSKNGKIVFSPVNLPHVTSLCELNTRDFPDALAFATKEALRIGTVDEIQRLHIKSVPLNEMARRVVHHKPSRAYILSSAKYETNEQTGEDTELCSIKLLDDTGFDILDTFKLDMHECAESLAIVSFSGDSKTYLAVGTGYVVPTELEPTKGRILLFEVETVSILSSSAPGTGMFASSSSSASANFVSGKLKLVHEIDVAGMVWCMTQFNGKLLCGISCNVQLYSWNETRDGGRELALECEHGNHVQVLCMATKDEFIYVGDLLRGTSVLVYRPVDSRIEQLAADFRPNCIMAVAILADHHYLAAENSLNLMTTNLNLDAQAADDRDFLTPVGAYHLGDSPNAFRSGSLVMQLTDADSLLLPSILYATVSGAIGVIASLPAPLYNELLRLQNAILKIVKGIGGFDHADWRAYHEGKKTSPATNFIDGDLIESILDFSPEEQAKIAKVVGLQVEDMIKRIEAVAQATH